MKKLAIGIAFGLMLLASLPNVHRAHAAVSCTEIYSGGPIPFLGKAVDNFVICGNRLDLPFAAYGSDIHVPENSWGDIPAGYFCDGDVQILGTDFFMNGESSEGTVTLTYIGTPRHAYAGFGMDCQAGGMQRMENRCNARLNEHKPNQHKVRCLFFYDPDGPVPWSTTLTFAPHLPSNVVDLVAHRNKRKQGGYDSAQLAA